MSDIRVSTSDSAPKTAENLPFPEFEDELHRRLSLMADSFGEYHRLDERDFLGRIFEATFELIPEAEKGSLYLLRGDRYRPIFSRGYDIKVLSRISFSREEAFIDFDVSHEAPVEAYLTRIESRDPARFPKETMEAFAELGTLSGFWSLYAPIKVEGRVRGLLSLETFHAQGYSRTSWKVLKFYARLISDFYAQILQREKESRHYRELVTALVSAIEVMDEYTKGHAQRVSAYAVAIARRMGLESDRLAELETAALLHDIGKLGMPIEALQKSGRLEGQELGIMRRHPANAKRILGGVSGFERIAEIAYRHHECYDGCGYPDGLSGEAIPLEAAILQLADSFDAMTSDRSYRSALTRSEALREIGRGAGTQFHPGVAKVALEILADFDPGTAPTAEER